MLLGGSEVPPTFYWELYYPQCLFVFTLKNLCGLLLLKPPVFHIALSSTVITD